MKPTELYEEIRKYCRANADEAVVRKYSRYFKEGYDAYGLTREKIEDKVDSILSDKKVNMKLVLSASRHCKMPPLSLIVTPSGNNRVHTCLAKQDSGDRFSQICA